MKHFSTILQISGMLLGGSICMMAIATDRQTPEATSGIVLMGLAILIPFTYIYRKTHLSSEAEIEQSHIQTFNDFAASLTVEDLTETELSKVQMYVDFLKNKRQ